MAKLDDDGVNEVSAVWLTCENARNNKMYPEDPRVTVVTPVANDPNKKVVVKTVRMHDLSSVRRVCNTAAQTFFVYAEGASAINPIAKGVVTAVGGSTDNGQNDCRSFLYGAWSGDPLLVISPSILAGVGITMQ